MQIKHTSLIGSASGWGGPVMGSERGPATLKEQGLVDALMKSGIHSKWADMISSEKSHYEHIIPLGKERLPLIKNQLLKLAHTVQAVLKDGDFPCVIGGDHTMAAATFSAVVETLNVRGEFGLIWIDAHMDSHTPDTTPSQAYHGMPLAALMGYGEPALKEILSSEPKIKPSDITLIGIRSYEEGEAQLLKELGVRIIYAEQVKEIGFKTVIKEAIEYVTKNTKAFGVSLDLDAFDPEFAPGVGTKAPNGLDPAHVLPYLHLFRENKKFAALEVTEYNPDTDINGKTAQLLQDALKELLPQ